jgi:hypothetical protein
LLWHLGKGDFRVQHLAVELGIFPGTRFVFSDQIRWSFVLAWVCQGAVEAIASSSIHRNAVTDTIISTLFGVHRVPQVFHAGMDWKNNYLPVLGGATA